METNIFKYSSEYIEGIIHYIPKNDFAKTFLALNQNDNELKFSEHHLEMIKKLSILLNFEMKEK